MLFRRKQTANNQLVEFRLLNNVTSNNQMIAKIQDMLSKIPKKQINDMAARGRRIVNDIKRSSELLEKNHTNISKQSVALYYYLQKKKEVNKNERNALTIQQRKEMKNIEMEEKRISKLLGRFEALSGPSNQRV